MTRGNVYTTHRTRIITRNTEKANFHEIVAFNYTRGIFEVKTGRGNSGSSNEGKTQTVDLHKGNTHVTNWKYNNYLVHMSLPYASKDTSQSYANTYEPCFMPMIDMRSWQLLHSILGLGLRLNWIWRRFLSVSVESFTC